MLPQIAIFESGDHAINVLEISHWSQVPTSDTRNHTHYSELRVFLKNGQSVTFTGQPYRDVQKDLKAFLTRIDH